MFQNTRAAEEKSPGNFCQSPQEVKKLSLSTVERGALAEVDRKLALRSWPRPKRKMISVVGGGKWETFSFTVVSATPLFYLFNLFFF